MGALVMAGDVVGVGVDDAMAHLASACLIAEENTNAVPKVLASDVLRCALQTATSTRYRFPRSAEMYQLTTDSASSPNECQLS
jgi:hypothetical protein